MSSHADRRTFFCGSAVVIIFWLTALYTSFSIGGVTLPDETFGSPKQLQAVLLDIHQQSYESAIDRMYALTDQHAAELTGTDDGGLMSVDQFFALLAADDLAAMQDRYNAKFGADAEQMLARIENNPEYRPEDLYRVAKRHPLTRAAGVALADAARRATEQGDLPSAREFFLLAVQHGWHGDADHVGPATSANYFGNSKLLPFDAPWFNLPSGFSSNKIFPVGTGDLAFVSGEHAVLAMKSDGVAAWRWDARSPMRSGKFDMISGSTGRGWLSVPATLDDQQGRPRVVVVCQSGDKKQRGYLAALRTGDGRLLWSTDADPALESFAFLSSPAILGRYVIAIGLQSLSDDSSGGSLQLVAVDITNGHLLWHTLLANISATGASPALSLYLDQSPPAIVDDCVLTSPNIGAIYSVDRFDGQLRWVRPYRQAVPGDRVIRKFVDQRSKGRDLIAPLAWTDLLRWDCTPRTANNVMMSAPQDTAEVMALDYASGKMLWQSSSLPQATPVGIAGGKLILSGSDLTAIEPATGLKVWTFTPVSGVRLTGPAVVGDDYILVRSTAGLLSVSPLDGTSTPSQATDDFHPIAASEAGKAALAGIGIVNAFGIPVAGKGAR